MPEIDFFLQKNLQFLARCEMRVQTSRGKVWFMPLILSSMPFTTSANETTPATCQSLLCTAIDLRNDRWICPRPIGAIGDG